MGAQKNNHIEMVHLSTQNILLGPVEQSVESLIVDLGVVISIHTLGEIDHETVSMFKGCCLFQAKVCALSTG